MSKADDRSVRTETNNADYDMRVRFLRRLTEMKHVERHRLLAIEQPDEIHVLWDVAMRERLTDIAATIETHANERGYF